MRIGLAKGTTPPLPLPTAEDLEIGGETVVLTLMEARELLIDADDRSMFEIRKEPRP